MTMNQRAVRVGLVGVGNCASSFVQGLSYYRDRHANVPMPGLMSPDIGGIQIADIEVSSAFDVHAGKVGLDLSEAIRIDPNNTIDFAEVPHTGCRVCRGPALDGIGRYVREHIPLSEEPEVDVAEKLVQSRTNVVVSFLPVGSQKATEFYAEQALAAGCAFVNCIPVFIASDAAWRRRFEERSLPLIGDDIKSQVGATIVHRALAQLFCDRGVSVDRTYQLNFGGNADFLNMLERERVRSKKISKTRAVTSLLGDAPSEESVHIGPSDHVPWLTDRKLAYIRLEGTAFGGVPLSAELRLEVWDSPNSAGVVVDAVRCAKLALNRKIGGALVGPSSYFMKSPPQQLPDHIARAKTVEFIGCDGHPD